MNERNIEIAEKIVQFALLSIFTLLATMLALTFGFASALITIAFMTLKASLALTTSIVEEILVRKETRHATQRRWASRVQASR